jgi:phage terminase small subunit
MGKRMGASKPNVLYAAASRVSARPEVQRRVAELRQAAAQTTALDLQERVQELRDIESADPTAIQYHPACRYCYGVGHRYQFIDEAEYAAHVAEALAAGRAPEHDSSGGFDYDGSMHPAPDCPRCFGGGAAHLYTVDITRLPRREARLVKGFGKNGELLLHSQMEARSQLSKLLGLDRPDPRNIAREAAAAAAGAAIGTSVAAALTPEERMRAYHTMLKG